MKKVLVFLILMCVPFIVKADDVKVNNFYMNATIEENGDLTVEEYFYASGEYNGYERDIYYFNPSAYKFDASVSSYGGSSLHNGSKIKLLDIQGLDRMPSFDFSNVNGTKFVEDSSPSNGDAYVYQLINVAYGEGYRMYLPSYKNKAFYLKYRISNLAIKHNDVGELGWNIFNDKFIDDIDNLVVYVNIPNNKNEIRVWGHGPLNGKTEIINKNQVKLSIENLRAYTAIDIRLTFDKDVIKNSSKLSNVDALDKILKYEQSKAEQANYEREQRDKITESEIQSELNSNPFYRSNYDRVEYLIKNLHQKELIDKYTKVLVSRKDEVDKNELEIFNSYIDYKHVSYHNYSEAYNHYNNIFSYELKSKIKPELDKYLRKVKSVEKRRDTIGCITILGLIILPIVYIVLYFNKKGNKFNHKYFRELPSLSASGVDYLYNAKSTKNGISATILDLIDQNKISVEKKNKSYELTLLEEKDNLTGIEQRAVEILFGSKKTINTKKPAKADYTDFTSFQSKALKEIKEKALLHKKSYGSNTSTLGLVIFIAAMLFPPLYFLTIPILLIYGAYKLLRSKKRYVLLFLVSIIVSIIIGVYVGIHNHFYMDSIKIMFIDIIIIFILCCYTSSKNKLDLTDEGQLELSKIKALRRYMKDFTILDKKELPEVRLWNKYLVYATALGVGKKVSKALKVYIEAQSLNTDLLTNYAICNTISNSIGSTMRSAYAAHYAASSGSSGGWSSGSGGGGGFSSGGGSFGGGSGGGHF